MSVVRRDPRLGRLSPTVADRRGRDTPDAVTGPGLVRRVDGFGEVVAVRVVTIPTTDPTPPQTPPSGAVLADTTPGRTECPG